MASEQGGTDKLRSYLLSQSIEGTPSSNIAVFDELQSHGVVESTPESNAERSYPRVPSRAPQQSQGQMLVSLSKLLQQKTDSVHTQIQGPHSGLKSGLKSTGWSWISVVLAGTKKGPEGPYFNHSQNSLEVCSVIFGAGNETRTRDPDRGKVVLYQLSYSRIVLMTGAILAFQIAASSL